MISVDPRGIPKCELHKPPNGQYANLKVLSVQGVGTHGDSSRDVIIRQYPLIFTAFQRANSSHRQCRNVGACRSWDVLVP